MHRRGDEPYEHIESARRPIRVNRTPAVRNMKFRAGVGFGNTRRQGDRQDVYRIDRVDKLEGAGAKESNRRGRSIDIHRRYLG